MSSGMFLYAPQALLSDGWAEGVRIGVDASGSITSVEVEASAEGAETLPGPTLPGMPNLHSHAFQRAMAGQAEVRGKLDDADSFWTWREAMYRSLDRLGPEEMEAIAAWLFVECLEGGYTAVAEFHYVHHDPSGAPYADPAEMGRRLLSAAEASGIGLTLLPVLYAASGFGGTPPVPAQRRFVNHLEGFFRIVSALQAAMGDRPGLRLGMAPHSLRAVPPLLLREALEAMADLDHRAPIHIHVAEQQAEVDACLGWSGRQPVEWLLENAPVDERWCLVHATHMSPNEAAVFLNSGAVAGLCPTTEANLGDGLFPGARYVSLGGRFGVGSDSEVCRSPMEELRLFEYGQRLHRRRRNVVLPPGERHVGAGLWRAACRGGAQALGQPMGAIASGFRADLLTLDPGHPALCGRQGDSLIDALVFAGGEGAIAELRVGGRRLVEGGRHIHREALLSRFRAAIGRMAG